ncbi:hypothetical protein ACA910_005211 [Epithemia clementina (nom. ined.)]
MHQFFFFYLLLLLLASSWTTTTTTASSIHVTAAAHTENGSAKEEHEWLHLRMNKKKNDMIRQQHPQKEDEMDAESSNDDDNNESSLLSSLSLFPDLWLLSTVDDRNLVSAVFECPAEQQQEARFKNNNNIMDRTSNRELRLWGKKKNSQGSADPYSRSYYNSYNSNRNQYGFPPDGYYYSGGNNGKGGKKGKRQHRGRPRQRGPPPPSMRMRMRRWRPGPAPSPPIVVPPRPPPKQPSSQTIADKLARSPRFTILVQALKRAGLWDLLKDTSQHLTLLAPTNQALRQAYAPALTFQDLIDDDIDTLTDILWYHLIDCAVTLQDWLDLKASPITMSTLLLDQDGEATLDIIISQTGVFVQGDGNQDPNHLPQIVVFDILASNGVIHVVDQVVLPDPTHVSSNEVTLADLIRTTPELSRLAVELLPKTPQLVQILDDPAQTLTVFGPSNAALALFGPDKVQYLVDNPLILERVIRYHLVDGDAIDARRLARLDEIQTAAQDGQFIRVKTPLGSADIFIQGNGNDPNKPLANKVTTADLSASNGFLHILSGVLLPHLPLGATVALSTGNSFSILTRALVATGLMTTLNGDLSDNNIHASPITIKTTTPKTTTRTVKTTYTLFAPTDAAFEELGQDTLDRLFTTDLDQFKVILLTHVILGTYDREDILAVTAQGPKSFPTLAPPPPPQGEQPQEIVIYSLGNKNGHDKAILVQGPRNDAPGAQVIGTAIRASNGILHPINVVLLPDFGGDPGVTVAPTTTVSPTAVPSASPTVDDDNNNNSPTIRPTTPKPLGSPTAGPTENPTKDPTAAPTIRPTTPRPLGSPTAGPTGNPTKDPTAGPTGNPTQPPTVTPTGVPSPGPTMAPTGVPTAGPTATPTQRPTTGLPTVSNDTVVPSAAPSAAPTESVLPTIIELLAQQVGGVYSTLQQLLNDTGLVLAMDDESDPPLTVFAPTDEAFSRSFGVDALAYLQANPEYLTTVLQYHMVSGVFTSQDFVALTPPAILSTLAFDQTLEIVITNSEGTFVNGNGNDEANLPRADPMDLMASNGIVHVVDRVILPTLPIGPTIATTTGFALLAKSMEGTGVMNLWNGITDPSKTFTVFAPTDDAFLAMGYDEAAIDALLAGDPESLRDILLTHTIDGQVLDTAQLADLVSSGDDKFATSSGVNITLALEPSGDLFVTGPNNTMASRARITVRNVLATNGIIHIIGGAILLP